jgi:hypothetical protein
MIVHVSMPADDCAAVARTLAAVMGGGAVRFPPGGPRAWTAWSERGETQIVVTPRGECMLPGEQEVLWSTLATTRAAESHFALCVERPAAEVLQLANSAGWPARICDRGGFFHVVEIWVEGAYLVEVLDPEYTAQYRKSMTVDNWLRHFGSPQ